MLNAGNTFKSKAVMMVGKKICFIGYGNIIRTDDGLGPYIVIKLRQELGENENFRFIAADQIDIALAPSLAEFDEIVFIDAAVDIDREVLIEKITPDVFRMGFTTHLNSFTQLMHLVTALYGTSPAGYIVRVHGYEFGFGEALSVKGEHAAGCAVDAILSHISGI